MQEELLRNNVDIRLKSKVDKIVVENNVCKGLCGRNFIASKSVLSNGNLIGTIFNLVGEDKFTPQSEKVRRCGSTPVPVRFIWASGRERLSRTSAISYFIRKRENSNG